MIGNTQTQRSYFDRFLGSVEYGCTALLSASGTALPTLVGAMTVDNWRGNSGRSMVDASRLVSADNVVGTALLLVPTALVAGTRLPRLAHTTTDQRFGMVATLLVTMASVGPVIGSLIFGATQGDNSEVSEPPLSYAALSGFVGTMFVVGLISVAYNVRQCTRAQENAQAHPQAHAVPSVPEDAI